MTPVAGPFWPQGHNLNKLGRGILDDDTTYQNFKALLPCGVRQEEFFMFSLFKLMQNM